MRSTEFIGKLEEELSRELPSHKVQEHVLYYRGYINEEMSSGKSEEAVLDELGDPWAIARNIIEMSEEHIGETVYEQQETNNERQEKKSNTFVWQADSIFKKIGIVLIIVLVIWGIFSLVTGVISLFAPLIIPIIVVSLVLRFLSRRN